MFASLNNGFSRLSDHPDFAKLLLRLTFGILMLFHGAFKLQHGVGWVGGLLAQHGLPAFIAYGAYIGEIVTPLMILIGFMTRPAALIYAVNLVVATLLVHTADFFTRTQVGAWKLETEALYFMGGIIIMLLGAGRYVLVSNPRLQ